ncbi:heavy metal translocating P-type ATPase [Lactiplantibacillus plantarum]|uniref:heavy metal translocating P-type ATPase n=1 Tax=Lactiplantibacillus plantarum TaxID=1590 RepID=UPI00234A6952|nr:heavy metal translocating P-type ATPase [Lactiplantibacillus plantarum]MCG0556688.1 cadmium-/zinc-/cobalt-transporting ATPase [Lactiplantibacillus plantarum]MCG0816605.1 cadmium-/zinc-/cobalt-transporting ATPase [Lactiplantibacillus plantarum]MCG0819673.1 cadmium-/zinc-/cobalt-transporting ATPase [Lactiplantibacillus plantarum]MCG0822138.1 cadmium-/zinc-/cobalt-transporting ATPase [Lactiplantibacillus plantarum]MCG0841686.1 cadmium-/zinc-/cobalt-transporting ATPase [Lactiplantibacillus plan
MRHYYKLILTVSVGIIAVILQFGLHYQLAAQIIITLMGSLMALSMLVEMIKTLRSGKYGVDLLAITAIVATLAVGEYWASLVVLIMLTGGDSLEDYAAKRANTELKALLDNSPRIAHRSVAGQLTDIAVEDVQIGDQLVVKPGELVPVDGHLIQGTALFDESSLTGESKPVDKHVGDDIMSGAVNGDSAVTMVVDKLAIDSQYQQLVKLVKESESRPAKFVRLADRYAVPFTLVAYVIAGVAWAFSGDPHRFAEVLVVASPCPLILAAPVALVSGMSRTSRNGVVVKTGDMLEKLSTAKSAAFDKTGTITSGQLTVNQIVPQPGFTAEQILHLAASAEQNSSHILARSLVKYASATSLSPVTQLAEVTGNGVTATIEQQQVKVGKLKFVAPTTTAKPLATTAIYVGIDDQYAGYITFIDNVRPEAAATLQALHAEGVQNVMMLTGDQQAIADHIAADVGIDTVAADLLPADKIAHLKAVPAGERPVIMVGDGVNDAPSLAVADVGIAMGAHGSTAASESADVVILKDDLSRVVTAVRIAKDTMQVAKQAVWIGIAICTILMLIASTGIIPALFGAMLQEVVDTVSILWALRALRDRPQSSVSSTTTTPITKDVS